MRRTCSFLLMAFGLIFLVIQPAAFAGGRVEHHQITSKILTDAGQPSKREFSVYLPEEYDASETAYPVFYLIHGWTGTNRTFLGAGYPSYSNLIGEIYINKIMDTLIEQGLVHPMMVVLPHVQRGTPEVIPAYRDYIIEEIIAFVDAEYRTIPERYARAIAGHSAGGNDAVLTASSRPDVFGFVGAYTAYFAQTPRNSIFQENDMTLFPLYFWIYVGTNDHYTSIPPRNRGLVEVLKTMNLPHIHIEDDGNHWNRIKQRIEESIVFFSDNFISPTITSVEFYHKLIATWGGTKSSK